MCLDRQQNTSLCRANEETGATGLEPATSGVTGRSWCFRVERGSAGIPTVSRASRAPPCGDSRAWAGARGRLARDERGMTHCLNSEQAGSLGDDDSCLRTMLGREHRHRRCAAAPRGSRRRRCPTAPRTACRQAARARARYLRTGAGAGGTLAAARHARRRARHREIASGLRALAAGRG
jgi:hypothetical protein